MKRMRSPMVVGLFFCLISLGQVCPLALTWGMTKHQHSCCCSGITKPCDCDHAKQRGFKKKLSCHQQKKPTYAKAPCGGKTEEQVLSFQGDPFLLDRGVGKSFQLEIFSTGIPNYFYPNIKSSPESPPPKA